MDRKALHEILQTFDIALVPLKTRIYGSVPSKIFEYTALGFPVLYFGGGEGETIVEENQLGWVASVGNFESLDERLVEISKLNKAELATMKLTVFNKANISFDLNDQLKKLIEKEVF
jgi:glycosyltransferase involved in cell wall biosynthesis